MENKEMTPERLFEIASEQYYKVYDFGPKTKKSDKTWIRVGLIPDPNKEIKWNFFNGLRLLCDEPFDKAEVFLDGTSIVIRNNEYNVLRDDGTFVFNNWHHYVARCTDGKHYIVEDKEDDYGLVTKGCFADSDGRAMTVQFDTIMPMNHDGRYCIGVGSKIPERTYAVYDLAENRIISDWYDSMLLYMWKDRLGQPFARVVKNDMHNFIDTEGKLVFDKWSKKPIEVRDDGSCQLHTEDGKSYNANVLTRETKEIV